MIPKINTEIKEDNLASNNNNIGAYENNNLNNMLIQSDNLNTIQKL